jgi:DNA ligase-1
MMTKTLPTLFKIDSIGRLREWTVHIEDSQFYAIKGLVEGKKTQDKSTRCVAKNVGRSNETTPQSQAGLEAQSKWQKKLDADYAETPEGAKTKKFFEPMLALNYDDRKAEVQYPIYSQPKLDGIRCIVRKEGDELIARSRKGKIIYAVPHILSSLKGLFETHPNTILDGELYNHELKENFNKITSLVRKQKPVRGKNDTDASFAKKQKAFAERLEEARETIQYWIYDTPQINILGSNANFSLRLEELNSLFPQSNSLVLVATSQIHNEKGLDEVYGAYLEDGYEGQMIRTNSPYDENKRSKTLLKRKEFQDAEYKVIDIDEGNGNRSGTCKHLVCYCEKTGKTFNSNVKGSWEYLKEILDNKDQYIGKEATIKFFQLTPDGIPRFPYAIAFRDYE